MSERRSDAARFVDWCQTANLGLVEEVLKICRVQARRRRDAEKVNGAPVPKTKRRQYRKRKTETVEPLLAGEAAK